MRYVTQGGLSGGTNQLFNSAVRSCSDFETDIHDAITDVINGSRGVDSRKSIPVNGVVEVRSLLSIRLVASERTDR